MRATAGVAACGRRCSLHPGLGYAHARASIISCLLACIALTAPAPQHIGLPCPRPHSLVTGRRPARSRPAVPPRPGVHPGWRSSRCCLSTARCCPQRARPHCTPCSRARRVRAWARPSPHAIALAPQTCLSGGGRTRGRSRNPEKHLQPHDAPHVGTLPRAAPALPRFPGHQRAAGASPRRGRRAAPRTACPNPAGRRASGCCCPVIPLLCVRAAAGGGRAQIQQLPTPRAGRNVRRSRVVQRGAPAAQRRQTQPMRAPAIPTATPSSNRSLPCPAGPLQPP